MFNCKHNGRSVKVVPLKAGWKRQTKLSSQEAENPSNSSLQWSYCFVSIALHTENKQKFPLLNKETFYIETFDFLPQNSLRYPQVRGRVCITVVRSRAAVQASFSPFSPSHVHTRETLLPEAPLPAFTTAGRWLHRGISY